jgi:hypothetical protein
MPEHFRRMAWLMGPLTENERKTFVRLLTKVLERAAEDPTSASTTLEGAPPPNGAASRGGAA